MPLRLLPMQEEDCETWMRVRAIAYRGPTNLIVHTSPLSEESFTKVAEERRKEFHKPEYYRLKVVDTDSGEIIACAQWSVYPHGKTEAGSKDDGKPPYTPPEVNLPALKALLGPLRGANIEIMGTRPYVMLNTLTTLPEHQRRGAASMLVQWGVDKADEMGVETYLDSSIIARPLYERFGFEVVKEVIFDRTQWGGEGLDYHFCMLRKPHNHQVADV
ncbi:acyl-CoA N-acyltransferase [Glonium stellatum]|uniref:Acyl-CoA N-acyltransferase n=1 Tax=Glonium stellatum TaxID=574774 RepID=A0A8E2FD77_9PEZI|nr:acyl-CoA N-acyltransferase [Glonium stellatum]